MKRYKSKRLTDSARGRECTMRAPNICNFNPETVVFCHVSTVGMSGIGTKNHDFFGFYGCSACHDWYDKRNNFDGLVRDRYALDAVCETQGIMFSEGLLRE